MILLVDSEDPDQTAHPRSLIRAFIVRICPKISDLSWFSATGSLELRLVSSAILEHTNNNTLPSWLGLVIVSNDRRIREMPEDTFRMSWGIYCFLFFLVTKAWSSEIWSQNSYL